jgi:CheY-like chemotaxis protein
VLLRTIRGVLRENGVPVQEKNGNQTVKEGAGNVVRKNLVVEDALELEAGTGAQGILTTVKKILIVEDDLELLRGLSRRLKANGYNTVVATDGITAVSVALKELPDVILLDIGLPAGDGFTVMERLKSHDKLRRVPIIVITARDPLTTRNRALSAGAQAFLLKPVENDILVAAIQKASGGN